MQKQEMTIGRLAKVAGVGIETIRYYQRRELLPTPKVAYGAFRLYPVGLADRIRFIKRAQDLGFTLDEIAELLTLEDGENRRAIRQVASSRLLLIHTKIADLRRMENVLTHLIHECEGTSALNPCPIIATLGDQRLPERH